MKKKHILSLLMMLILSLGISRICEAKQGLLGNTFESVVVYYGAGKLPGMTLKLNITVATPQGVYYGVYNSKGKKGDNMANESWTGPGSPPVLQLIDYWSADNSHCPGLDTEYFMCYTYNFKVTVNQDDNGCPWVAALYSYSKYVGTRHATYTAPTTRSSICPTVPVDTYDISWNPNFVQHEKVLKITPNGGTVETTLNTYLMESGTLCDGSKYDSRGAYCRFVATGITLTVLGCDNNIVTTTAVAHPITDKELHDINVAVNTKNVGPGTINATCNFQYILEQL